MTRKRKNINAVARPTHPGRQMYTAILGSRMTIGEVAGVLGCSRNQLVAILQGKARLSARFAFLFAELFTWDRALRWYMMQSKCDMYLAAVRERKARRALMDDDGQDYDTDKWAQEVKQQWEVVPEDYKEEKVAPSIEDVPYEDTTMEEEING